MSVYAKCLIICTNRPVIPECAEHI